MNATGTAIPLVLVGAAGRMGQSLLRELAQFPLLRLHAATVRAGSRALGEDAGQFAGLRPTGVIAGSSLERALGGAGLVLDFSSGAGAPRHVALCAAAGVPLLLGTTGLDSEVASAAAAAAARIPVLLAANTSLGAAVLQEFVQRAAAALGPRFQVHVQDTHHRDKKDAPSGTALALGQAALAGQGALGGVQYSSIRGGDVVGEHEVQFLGTGERLRLAHVVTDRAVFAAGALRAGLWLVGQRPGTYRMADIFKEK